MTTMDTEEKRLRIYRAIIQTGNKATVKDIARISGLPEYQVREITERMHQKGYLDKEEEED